MASQVGEEVQATSAVSKAVAKVKTKSIKGSVTDSQGRILVGATVYFIDASTINFDAITQASMGDRSAEDRDEPLEDIIRDDVKRAALPFAITDSKGRFKAKLPVARHFAFVEPNNSDYLPGGSVSREAFLPTSLPKTGLNIQVSWATPGDATYIGTTACLVCHDGGLATDKRGWGSHGHALMYTRASGPTTIQDFSKHPGWDDFANKFLPGTTHTTGTKIFLVDYDKLQTRRFILKEGSAGTSTVFFTVYLWKDTNDGNKSKVTVESAAASGDAGTINTYEALGFMGGYIRQRVLLKIEPTRLGFFRGFQFQAIAGSPSQGQDFNYDRNKKPYTESGSGGGGIRDLFDETGATPKQKLPSAVSKSSISCALCHNGGATQVNKPALINGEQLFTTVGDPNGVFATGEASDGLQDLGITCEQCHGPGSKHREQALLPDEIISKKVTITHKGKHIVQPEMLSVERASLICGRCHGSIEAEHPWPMPGISRAEWLDMVVDEGNSTGVSASRLWADGIHEKGGHHGMGYTNYMQSVHYRNDRKLVACFDCHGLHGETDYKYGLKADPDDSTAGLCQSCHLKDIRQHMEDKTGDDMKGLSTKCYECHMTRTGTGGAGKPGLFNGTPTGNPATDPSIVYWQGDQSSHVWDVPSKMSVGVASVQPALAMPTPYTNNCGTCHDASALPFLPPEP
ncbi:MAG: cytochrome c3 family protein [Planctomycetes bacterium]|nr:cytochrome c3 family protein [Planctomycetota bacterium]